MKRRFNRFELKYVIDAARRDALLDEIRSNMAPDPYGEDGTYRVTSLYYDSPDFVCFDSKIEGIRYRRKVRIRTYGAHEEDPTAEVAVEIKQRINRTVQKRRVGMPLAEAVALLAREHTPDVADDDRGSIIGELEYLTRSLVLQPACVITYLRQAWVGSRYEPGLRLTFDQRPAVRSATRMLGPGSKDRPFMPETSMIMEVKADDAVPLWVSRMLARNDCSLTRISKYCVGLTALREGRGG